MISNIPLLSLLIWTPIAGGLMLLLLPNKDNIIKLVSIGLSLIVFILSLILLINFDTSQYSLHYVEKYSWIKNLNINYHLAIDGFSLTFILLTTLITFLTILYNFSEDCVQYN